MNTVRLKHRSRGALLAILLINGCASAPVDEPFFRTPESAIKGAIAEELGMPISLRVETFKSQGAWAFVAGRPLTADGAPIDYSKTPYAKDVTEGFFDDSFVALVRHEDAENSRWAVVELSVGATDAPFVDWPERHGLPPQLIIPRSLKK